MDGASDLLLNERGLTRFVLIEDGYQKWHAGTYFYFCS
jgi:hypothetical protein